MLASKSAVRKFIRRHENKVFLDSDNLIEARSVKSEQRTTSSKLMFITLDDPLLSGFAIMVCK